MKELLEKFFGMFQEGVEKLKEGNSTEAIEKFTKASELTSEVTKSAETLEKTTVENLEKFFEGESGKEVLKKYVYVDFNGEDLADIIKQLKEGVDAMAKLESLEKSLEELKKEKETDDKTISDALNSLSEDVEKVAGALLKKVSKQDS